MLDPDFALISFVVFLGAWAGALIPFASPDELRIGRDYFIFARNILFAAVIPFGVYHFLLHFFMPGALWIALPLLGLVIFSVSHFIRFNGYFSSFLLGAVVYLSYGSWTFIMAASVVTLALMLQSTCSMLDIVKKDRIDASPLRVVIHVSLEGLPFFVCLLFYHCSFLSFI